MDKNTFDILYKDTIESLRAHRLLDALNALSGLIPESEELAVTREDYIRLLDYFKQGLPDPDRETLFLQFINKAYLLSDKAKYDFLKAQLGTCFNRLYTLRETDEFYQIAASAPYDRGAYEQVSARLKDETLAEAQKQIILSALTLSVAYLFDAYKIQLLLENVTSSVLKIRARALSGLVLACILHYDRLSRHADLTARLQLLADVPDFCRDLLTMQLQLMRTAWTKKDESKLRDEIMPDIYRAASKMTQGKDLDFTNPDELANLDLNPAWASDEEVDNIGKKMQALADMREQGVDTFYTTFAQISRTHAFFSDIKNWFTPFSLRHSVFGDRGESLSGLSGLFEMHAAGDTEKFGMFLMIDQLSSGQLDGIKQNIRQINEQQAALQDKIHQTDAVQTIAEEIRFCMQDLYRFFSLYRYRDKDANPFASFLSMVDLPLFKPILQTKEALVLLGNYAFREQEWTLAVSLFQKLDATMQGPEILEKSGYCCQQLKEWDRAIIYYERANLMRPDSAWTLRQLSVVCVQAAQYDKALKVFKQLEMLEPENANILLRYGECLILAGESEAAFEKLFKSDYLHSDARSTKALAWCSMLAEKYEQAEKYYKKLIEKEEAQAVDYQNAAHNAWLLGLLNEALARYRACLRLRKMDFAPADFFVEDVEFLNKRGKTNDDIQQMRDALNS